MGAGDAVFWLVDRATHELALFATVGILIGGADELLIDLIWGVRSLWRRLAVYSRHARADAGSLAAPARPGRIAIFIPAWRESAVIGPMLATATARWGAADYRIYVACYPNDRATIDAVAAAAEAAEGGRIRLVINRRDGPTTKADNLNALWAALLRDERAGAWRAKAIALHDAEDVVHAAEIALFDRLIERFDLVQLPVVPIVGRERGWWARAISGHYGDEFAEAHIKALVVREALGAAVPAAGVGCAFSRTAMAWIAAGNGGLPFDADSMTEDYELGLRIAEGGGRGAFIRLPGRRRGAAVAVRAHFPATLDAAIRQKARWMTGIALSGWDRLGWRGGLAERWMRMRDRRAVLAAFILFAAYASLIGWAAVRGLELVAGYAPIATSGVEAALFRVDAAILLWRLAMRAGFAGHAYGWRAGLAAVPRVIVANIIAMIAARRAVARYLHAARGGTPFWDKTDHVFPGEVPAE